MKKQQVPIVRIEFHELQNLVLTPEEYVSIGKWKGVMKQYRVTPKQLKGIVRTTTDWDTFHTLLEWEG